MIELITFKTKLRHTPKKRITIAFDMVFADTIDESTLKKVFRSANRMTAEPIKAIGTMIQVIET